MGAYDSVYARCNCDWPDDERCKALPDDQTRWFNHLLWLESVKQKCSALPERFDAAHWSKRLSVSIERVEEMVKSMASEGLIGWSQDGRIVICGSQKSHPKLSWSDEEPESLINPFKKSVGWGIVAKSVIPPDNQPIPPDTSANPVKPPTVEKRRVEKRRVSTPVGSYTEEFEAFWSAYPQVRREGKAIAFKSWATQKPNLESVLSALSWQPATKKWTDDGGKYIPMPSTYINQRRWEDERPGVVNGVKKSQMEIMQEMLDRGDI